VHSAATPNPWEQPPQDLSAVVPFEQAQAQRQAEPSMVQGVTWETPDTADLTDSTLRVIGALHFIFAILLGAAYFHKISSPYALRFQTDNAIGAAANALEQLIMLLGVWVNLFGGFACYGYAALRRIRNAVTPTKPSRYFR
jgi:hypothetical protein